MKPILVDTSVWVEHFRGKESELQQVLKTQIVYTHEFVLGELSLGHYSQNQKAKIFRLLECLQQCPTSTHAEVYGFVHEYELASKGIGWIDVHLLHSCYRRGLNLLTRDQQLSKMAKRIL